jgi:hypothetical protein
MQLEREYDATTSVCRLVCRQGRLASVISSSVMAALLIGSPVACWWFGAPAFFWIIFAITAVLIVPMFAGDVLAKFRRGNWLLAVRADGLCIHLRSYQDQAPSGDDPTVVRIDFTEIDEVGRHVEHHSRPNSDGGSVNSKMQSLDIRLTHQDTGAMAEALKLNRKREQPTRVILGFMSMRSGLTHFAVSLPAPGTIRVNWRGDGHWVTPSLGRTLAVLEQRVRVTESSEGPRKDWKQMTPTELDEQVLELTRSGNRMAAIKLLVNGRGYSLTDAHRFVEELGGRV